MDHQSPRRRQHRSPAEWQTLLAQFQSSGLNTVAFCRRHAISESSFHHWRTKLAGSNSSSPTAPLPPFVDLGPLVTAPASEGRLELRLDLGAGIVLTLVRG
jgi:transposase-like protein